MIVLFCSNYLFYCLILVSLYSSFYFFILIYFTLFHWFLYYWMYYLLLFYLLLFFSISSCFDSIIDSSIVMIIMFYYLFLLLYFCSFYNLDMNYCLITVLLSLLLYYLFLLFLSILVILIYSCYIILLFYFYSLLTCDDWLVLAGLTKRHNFENWAYGVVILKVLVFKVLEVKEFSVYDAKRTRSLPPIMQ